MRFLPVEAAQVTVRNDQEWRSKYFHLSTRGGRKIANVAMARRLAVRLFCGRERADKFDLLMAEFSAKN